MLKTVKDMYESAVLKDTALLSTYSGDFWNEYIQNHKEYDRLFMRMFKSFKYFLQDGSESIDVVLTNFVEDVKLHLMVNSKKYSELYSSIKEFFFMLPLRPNLLKYFIESQG